MKAVYVDKCNAVPPFTHLLVRIAEEMALDLTEAQLERLEIITDFNLEARYPRPPGRHGYVSSFRGRRKFR